MAKVKNLETGEIIDKVYNPITDKKRENPIPLSDSRALNLVHSGNYELVIDRRKKEHKEASKRQTKEQK